MVADSCDSMVVLNLISTPRPLLSPADAVIIHQSRYPPKPRKLENPIQSELPSAPPKETESEQPPPARSTQKPRYSLPAYVVSGIPHLTRTPWELERSKRSSVRSTWKRSTNEPSLPPSTLRRLPREVYDCVVDKLEQMHLEQDQACSSCYLKDLYSLSLTNRSWDRAATLQMYRNIYIANNDHPGVPKLKITGTNRLKLLRRTLRERKALARMVRELHLPDLHILYQNATIEREEIVNLVASLVMACPNLERLVGFHIPYTHSFDRLSYALSTRPALKERVWCLADRDAEIDEDEEDDPSHAYYHRASDPTEHFLDLNYKYSGLKTLALHQEPARTSNKLTFRAIIGTLRQLPTLRNLHLSNLTSTSFSNITLTALPPHLHSLRLESLPGVTDKGLQRFAASPSATPLQRLTLLNLEIAHLPTIAAFLSPALPHLTHFTLAQHRAPTLPPGTDPPTLSSPSLTHIHWELRSQAGPPPALLPPFRPQSHTEPSFPFTNDEPIASLGTALLARSIATSHFPRLRSIRAPHDPQGTLQALCKPLATALLPSDAAIFTAAPRRAASAHHQQHMTRASVYSTAELSSSVSLKEFLATTAPDRSDSVMGSPASGARLSFDEHSEYGSGSSSRSATHARPAETPLVAGLTPVRSRLAAQSRILAARREAVVGFRVTDPGGEVSVESSIGGFVGDVKSGIAYVLRPDRGRMIGARSGGWWDGEGSADGEGEEDGSVNQWVTGVGDVLGDVGGKRGGGGGGGYPDCRHLVRGIGGRRAVEVGSLFE